MENDWIEVPRLKWVLVDAQLHDVSEFSHLIPKSRPDVICPVCKRQVTMKLGRKKAHHYAHRPEDTCPTSNPETLIHLNCKFHIYEQLKQANEVYLSTSCQLCHKPKPFIWKQGWDKVEVEYTIDSIRPDVALIKSGEVIGAIEVYVTHAVDEIKAKRLELYQVDWIEISGHIGFYEGRDAWHPHQPLDPIKQEPKSPSWLCSECEKRQRVEEFKRNNPINILSARIIDLYYESGKKYRRTFYVKEARRNGEKTRLWIEDNQRKIIAIQYAPINRESEQRLNEAFKTLYIEMYQRAAKLDDEMPWTPWESGRKFVPWDFDNFPFRYRWREDKKQWKFQQELNWKKIWK